ncbi:MAG: type III-B CRISPR module RAMP protein Cmr1 [Acidobacteriota bacterium]|nr:type III-B CRISPR module RAMP protein Cmr1 [Acidobacteriota bacterium]
MKITLQPKTPLWTGDIDSKSDFIQSTGVMGSLRWWAEAILRGMGYFACDPTEDNHRCPKEANRNNQKIPKYCPACLVFGATGIRRLFKLEISGGERVFNDGAINIKPDGRNRGWYLGSGLIGEIDLRTISLDRDFDDNLVLLPILIASNWGALGARTQHGYGVVVLEQKKDLKIDDFKNAMKERLKSLNVEERKNVNNKLPNLKEMFFAKVQFEVQDNDWWKEVDGIRERGRKGDRNYYEGYINDPRMVKWVNAGSVPIAPAIKNWLRFGKQITIKNGKKMQVSPFKNLSNKSISGWLFGESNKDKKSASKINISCAYKIDNNLWEFRIWGWIPKSDTPNGLEREAFLDSLKQALSGGGSVTIPWKDLLGNQTSNHKLIVWKEFSSEIDTGKTNESNFKDFVQSLLQNEGGY